jgi:hypothetical protein
MRLRPIGSPLVDRSDRNRNQHAIMIEFALQDFVGHDNQSPLDVTRELQ